jgi:hypothetical protein
MMKKGRIIADGPKGKILTSVALTGLFGKRLKLIQKRNTYDLISG